MVAKVLSCKYFPSSDTFDPQLGSTPSFAWRGIFFALQRLRLGFHWRIGMDSNVKMHVDRWGGSILMQLNSSYTDSSDAHVLCGEFMLPHSTQWNVNLVQRVFSVADVARILQCPMAPVACDRIVWSGHLKRVIPTTPDPIWLILSRLLVPPKIKLFGWRLGHDALPTASRLVQAGLSVGICCMCADGLKTIKHAFCECTMVVGLLSLAGFISLVTTATSSRAWLLSSFQQLPLHRFSLYLIILWNIWHQRNTFWHEGRLIPDWNLVQTCFSMFEGFIALESFSSATTMPELSISDRWHKPEATTVTINVDSACLPSNGCSTVGLLAGDHQGIVIAANVVPVEVP
ncbi:uncharacterized protein LOC120173978 [Hibiscus syriacus]|uniref:uncharacterized protein LOC120173978 n=1 Tax=Hibiscus syriacus TaxID=106335 RepID=UPI0019215693|nr:uncharacterized protein LOC120173978 [Hibiscus syriacus]